MYLNNKGIPIVVLYDEKVQIRKHKKKRINKKWIKRYGYKIYKNTLLKDGEVVKIFDKIYMISAIIPLLVKKKV